MKKLSMLLVAVLAVALMMGFVGCKQEDDTPAGPAVVATFANSDIEMELTTYNDNTWKIVGDADGQLMEFAKGTYSGDVTKDGKLECKMTHEFDLNTGSLKEINPATPFECTISNSGKTLSVPAFLFEEEGTEEMPPFDFIRK